MDKSEKEFPPFLSPVAVEDFERALEITKALYKKYGDQEVLAAHPDFHPSYTEIMVTAIWMNH